MKAARTLRTERAVLAPYSVWALLFVLVPLIFVAYYAFTDNSFAFTTEHITRFFTATSSLVQDDGSTTEVHTYLLIFVRSLKLAVISTVICLLLGYPIAYIMSRAKEKTQKTMMTLIMIPMWMNFLIRTYAWMTILQDTGIINGLLGKLGLGPIHVIGTETAVIIGMVYDYFPYMVLPIYSILAKLDGKLLEAARDLGCNSFSVLKRVVLPPEPAGHHLRHHDGAHPVDQHLLYLPKAGQRQILPHWRRHRGPVCREQPALCRGHRLYPDADPAGWHGADEILYHEARIRREIR